jgi:hypothetical protein
MKHDQEPDQEQKREPENHFGFALQIVNSSKEVQTLLETLKSSQDRQPVLHPQSKEEWFHRSAKGFIYGMC